MATPGNRTLACTWVLAALLAIPARAATPPASQAAPASGAAAGSAAPAASTDIAVAVAPSPASEGTGNPAAVTVAATSPATGSTAPATITMDPDATAADSAQQELLAKAIALIQAKKFETAINGPIDAVIASFEAQYGHDTKTTYYSTRSMAETLLYMAMAAKNNRDAKALGPTWQQAYFLKGSALNSLGRYDEASKALSRALALAPMNAQSMIELAFSYEHLHRTADALDLCESAEAMSAFSPDDLQKTEKARALRCKGYNLTDLHRYDDATKAYTAALQLNPDDTISKHELEYIREQASEGHQP